MRFFKNPNIDFINKRKIAFAISGLIILAGLISFIVKGGFNLSIDFAGGTLVQLKFDKPVDVGSLRDILGELKLSSMQITEFGSKDEVLIRFLPKTKNQTKEVENITDFLKQKIKDNNFEVRRIESVGPKVGTELKYKALWAILFSLIGILIYISIRFEFRFAIGAIVALFHDVLATLALFSLLDKEISLTVIAALLTIVGYSLNDTIVVFDRIREDVRTIRKKTFDEIINLSINQTLSRTIITSLTTLLVVIALLLKGGEVIFDFSLALFFGVVVGTYSSIFIASPILLFWQNRVKTSKKRY